MHAKNDIPTVLNTYAAKNGIKVHYGRELGVDPKMIAAAGERVREAVERANAELASCRCTRPASSSSAAAPRDPDANSNVSKITRLLWEGMGFGWAETGYSGVTFPLVEPCLQRVTKLGFKRVIVFPYFLFTGILIDRIYGFTDTSRRAHPEMQFVKAGYLNDHPQVIATFAERVTRDPRRREPDELRDVQIPRAGAGLRGRSRRAAGKPPPPCRGPGGLGARLECRGLRALRHFCTGACRLAMQDAHDHAHAHGHDHHHDHVHAPYPHADHPAGPESVRDRLKK